MSKPTFQVVKLGGSLLDFAGWESQFWRWLRASQCAQTIVVVGGGAPVERLRDEQFVRGLTEFDAHWEAIGAMGHNARRVAAKLLTPKIARKLVVSRLEQLTRALRQQPLVFVDPLELLREDEPIAEGKKLPCSWDVTSDSIAARICEMIGCQSLTLLKSTLPGSAGDYAAAAGSGYVDQFFPTAAAHLERVICVNLRSTTLESAMLERISDSRRNSTVAQHRPKAQH